jgi:hypothetical protein
MISLSTNGRVLPTSAQMDLLHAALDTDGQAVAHFSRCAGSGDLQGRMDEASFNILPLLWWTLSAHGFDDPAMPRLKGVFRNSWVQATRRAAVAEEILAGLRLEGIPTLCVKGLPLGLTYYKRPALRPMNDLDIVVPPHYAPRAIEVLDARGFSSHTADWATDRVLRHAVQHVHPVHGEIDLHWHVLFECPQQSADAHFWSAAVPLQVGSEASLQLCPTDALIHVLVHGIRWNPFPPMRWIADAAMILRSGGPIDWDRLLAFACRFRLGMRLSLGLDLLKHGFRLPVPPEALERIGGRRNLIEALELIANRGADERSAWRHIRRGTYALRMMQGENARKVPRALVRELWARRRRQRAGAD